MCFKVPLYFRLFKFRHIKVYSKVNKYPLQNMFLLHLQTGYLVLFVWKSASDSFMTVKQTCIVSKSTDHLKRTELQSHFKSSNQTCNSVSCFTECPMRGCLKWGRCLHLYQTFSWDILKFYFPHCTFWFLSDAQLPDSLRVVQTNLAQASQFWTFWYNKLYTDGSGAPGYRTTRHTVSVDETTTPYFLPTAVDRDRGKIHKRWEWYHCTTQDKKLWTRQTKWLLLKTLVA